MTNPIPAGAAINIIKAEKAFAKLTPEQKHTQKHQYEYPYRSISIDPLKTPAGSGLNAARAIIPQFYRGGMVTKTGLIKVHKGEMIVPKSKVKKVKAQLKNVKPY